MILLIINSIHKFIKYFMIGQGPHIQIEAFQRSNTDNPYLTQSPSSPRRKKSKISTKKSNEELIMESHG